MLTHVLRSSALLLPLLVLSLPAAAFGLSPGSLEANINNDTLQVEYDRPLTGASNLHINGSFLYTEEDSDSSATVATFGLQGVETDNRTYRAAIGARMYGYSAPGSNSGLAIAFGGLFYHVVPGAQRLSAGGYAWYAPKVTSFNDTETLYEVGGRVAYRAIQNTDVFLGYRHIHLKTDRGFNDPIEKGFHVGFRLNF
ncbi:YfaZ family outer membrane protein [Marinospirillum alkaliphilum]|uniref:YfaZ n=1 Tax=Marinospirillum alkaliphilum DSM 21637 TaxID=1122209 RepID=A0A1K1WP27_9GAMM|nr:YfaZ family outer membrane protein [Marinospirillum alkaliphilum]SFX38525.1 YfaZ precursor [Marinospirillum alkaliphilum DSM 21637]